MSKEKQIEEMADVYDAARLKARETLGSMNEGEAMWYSKAFYNAGYRKQSENMVEVVRCKDCTHFQTINGRTLCSVNATRGEKLWLGLRATVEDGFCHHGAKMKGGADQ